MGFVDSLKKYMIEDTSESSPRVKVLDATPAKRDPIKSLVKKFTLAFGGENKDFQPPEVDLEIVDQAYDAEAYVRQGMDKYIDKMFKAGWSFTGKNPSTLEYINMRFKYMAEVTKIPTEKLFIEFAEDVVKYSNSILVKSRMKDQAQLPPGLTVQGLNNLEPVVGYFPVNVTTMQVKRDQYGTIKQWQQEVAGATKKVKFKSDDVIHTYYKRKKGYAFGTPFIIPVLDDIRALREIEDRVLRVLYLNANPFLHLQIGSDELPGIDDEVTNAKVEMEGMDLESGLITTERWNMKAIATDKVIDIHPYLKYQEDRVFSGLGVPATMFGRGATANKSTSDNMDSEFIDRIKAFQRVIEADVNEFMIKELLMEGGFDPVLNADDMVYFKFNEIDMDMQIKCENHAIFKYEHCSISEDEMRQLLGLDPITDRSKMYTMLVEREKAQVAAEFTNTANEEKGTASTNNKVKPTNKKKNAQDFANHRNHFIFLESYEAHLDELNETIVSTILEFYDSKKKDVLIDINLAMATKEKILNNMAQTFVNSDSVEIVNIVHKRLFDSLKESILDAFKSMKYNDSDITKEGVIEIVNSAFKVICHRALTSIKAQVEKSKEV